MSKYFNATINDDIFKFIKPNDNDLLSKMDGFDLQDFLILIDDFNIKLRDTLGLDSFITFGLELEFENVIGYGIDKRLLDLFPNRDWYIKNDASLDNGAEINSPILKDIEKSWSDLEKVCSIIKDGASIGRKSGGHIHIGTQTLGQSPASWLNFIKIWAVYENIIYRFSYGEYLTARDSILEYASPIAKIFLFYYEKIKNDPVSINDIISNVSYRKNQAVNFSNVYKGNYDVFSRKNTIEFRCPNGTLNSSVWQNNVNFFVNLLTYSKSLSFNHDLIDKRQKLYFNDYSEFKWYDEIYLEQALELSDMIFNNNLDKIYFLKQYLKSFKVLDKNLHSNNSVLTKKIKL